MTQNSTYAESRALELLGQGLGPENVAPAVGLSVSRISQLLSDPEFSSKVAELRFESLSKHNKRDSHYDQLEDKLLQKMENLLPFMMKPGEVLNAIRIINGAKRRGSSAPDHIIQTQQVINLVMPTQIINQFKMDSNRQVIEAGQQSLITAQSGAIKAMLEGAKNASSTSPPPSALAYASSSK